MSETIEVDGVDVQVNNPGKVFFPALGLTEVDLVRYYLDVMPGVLAGARDRPTILKRHPEGVDGELFSEAGPVEPPAVDPDRHRPLPERAVGGVPARGRRAHVVWAINLGCIKINPWAVRAADLDHPDELRVDIDPTPGGEAPYPPHFPKAPGEPARVQPSKAKSSKAKSSRAASSAAKGLNAKGSKAKSSKPSSKASSKPSSEATSPSEEAGR